MTAAAHYAGALPWRASQPKRAIALAIAGRLAGLMRVLAALQYLRGVTLQLEAVRCGNVSCAACPHGPYWYAYFRRGGSSKKLYLGKRFDRRKLASWLSKLGVNASIPHAFMARVIETTAMIGEQSRPTAPAPRGRPRKILGTEISVPKVKSPRGRPWGAALSSKTRGEGSKR